MPRSWGGGPPWWDERGAGDWSAGHGPVEPGIWWRRRTAGCFVRLVAAMAAFTFVWFLAIGAIVALDLGDPGLLGGMAILALGLVVAVVLFAVIAVRGFRRYGEPVGDVMDATERLADGDLDVRVEERGPPPIRRLSRSFNQMARRLAATEERRRAMFADVSHELRTPVTVISGGLEAMIDGVHPADEPHLQVLLDETRVLTRLIEDLRTLSLVDAGTLPLEREVVDPAALVEEVVAGFDPAAETAGVTLTTDVGAGCPPLAVDRVRIREVLANLITNALRHTPPGGRIVVSARIDGEHVEFAVADDGEGIPAAVLPHVFDRYQRSADRGGSGLGLAIARSLVDAHGGTIAAESDVSTRPGTTIRVRLPLAG